jgi:hypothetical protein
MPPIGRRKRDDDSSCASSALDSLRRVVPPKKRRRTTILDAFQSICLYKGGDKGGEEGGDEEDANSSQAVADWGNGDEACSTDSSLDDDEDYRLLSDKQEAERKVMLELVFGPNSEILQTPTTAVDVKIQELIRGSLQQVAPPDYATQDDMTLDTAYSRISPPETSGLRVPMARSNSLPNVFAFVGSAEDSMDTTAS